MNDRKERQRPLIPSDQEGLWLVVFIVCSAVLLGARTVGGLVALLVAMVILVMGVISLILRGLSGASARILWYIVVLTSALGLNSAFREHCALAFWPAGLILTFVGSLGVGAAIAKYPRYIAPHFRSRQPTRLRSHDNH